MNVSEKIRELDELIKIAKSKGLSSIQRSYPITYDSTCRDISNHYYNLGYDCRITPGGSIDSVIISWAKKESAQKENKGCYFCSHFVEPVYDAPVWCNYELGVNAEKISPIFGRIKTPNIIKYEYAIYNKDLLCPYWEGK